MIDEDVLEKMSLYIETRDIQNLRKQVDSLSYESSNVINLSSEVLKITDSFEILEIFLDKSFYFKLYTEINKIYVHLLKSRDYGNLMSFISHLNGVSGKNIEKLKDFEGYDNVIINLIDLSEYFYSVGWMYECSLVLNITSIFVTTSNIFPKNIIRYFEILSYFFLDNNLFYSFLNAINNLLYLDNKIVYKYGTIEDFKRIVKYCKYKNEGSKYHGLLCKLTMIDENEIYNKIEKQSEIGSFGLLIKKNVDFKAWDFYIENVDAEIDLKSNINLISFFNLNDIEYKVINDSIHVGHYKYKSIGLKIHDIIDIYDTDDKKVIRKMETLKIDQGVVKEKKSTVVSKSTVKAKKTGVKFDDNFRTKKAKFKIYCLIAKNNFRDTDLHVDKRNTDRELRYQNVNNRNKKLRDDLLLIRATVDELRNELEQKIFDLFEKRETCKRVETNIKKPGNWRDEDSEEDSRPKETFTRSTRQSYKNDEVLVDRTIYTYNTSSQIYSDNAYIKQYKEANLTQFSSKNASSPYVPPPPESVLKNSNNFGGSKAYVPPNPSQVLKNKYNSVSNNLYTPPKPSEVLKNISATLKGDNSNASSKPTRKSSWYDSPSDE